ncbi:MAG: tautomerase family protein [Candidatus Lokiarchaeota archaeon]|nr:tautomerase family protein [Candidatus Lokiarchaeota archaeon]
MPNIIIEGPIIENIEIKRTLVKDITEIVEKAYGIPKEHIIITIKEFSPENVGVGGELISDRRK